MTDRGTALEDVAALMLERQKYESWLASLEARRAATPDHVFNRVHGDYEARLREVTESLLKHRSALQQHLEVLTNRLGTVETESRRFRDQRAEAELRMQVGELSVPDWNALARQCDEGVARLSEEQAQIRSQLAQAREILSMVAGQARQPDASPPAGAAGGAAGTAPPSRATPHSSMNELEFLNTVVGQPGEMPAQLVSPTSRRPTPHDPARRAEPTPSASPRAVPGGTPARSGTPARPGTPAMPAPAAPVKPPEPVRIHEVPAAESLKVVPDGSEDLGESLVSRVNSGTGSLREQTDAESLLQGTKGPNAGAPKAGGNGGKPVTPRGAGADRHKTLKCGDCGAMNFPTEWYCERCGAELAAL